MSHETLFPIYQDQETSPALELWHTVLIFDPMSRDALGKVRSGSTGIGSIFRRQLTHDSDRYPDIIDVTVPSALDASQLEIEMMLTAAGAHNAAVRGAESAREVFDWMHVYDEYDIRTALAAPEAQLPRFRPAETAIILAINDVTPDARDAYYGLPK